MRNCFMAGRELVQWDLEVLRTGTPDSLRLTIHHSQGTIVEYFRTIYAALERQHEIEQLLVAARGAGAGVPVAARTGAGERTSAR